MDENLVYANKIRPFFFKWENDVSLVSFWYKCEVWLEREERCVQEFIPTWILFFLFISVASAQFPLLYF